LKYKEKIDFSEYLFKELIRKIAALLLNTSSFGQILTWPGITRPLLCLQPAN
jgi:hypothetical protein